MTGFPILIAHDAGPTAGLAPLLLNDGWLGYLLNAGKNQPPSEKELRAAIADASIVICGMSSEVTADFELTACKIAVELGKPIALFADTFGRYVYGWFAPFRPHVRLVFVVTPKDVAGAEALFPNAQVVAAGNPAWETFFVDLSSATEKRLHARRTIGVSASEMMLFISGTKDFEVNAELLTGAAEAVWELSNFRIVFSQHPGDKTPAEKYREIGGDSVIVLASSQIRGDDAVFGADIVVTYNDASLAVASVAMRRRLICYHPPKALARFVSETGGTENPLVAAGAAYDGGATPESLRNAMQHLSRPWVSLVSNQEDFLPSLTSGASVAAMTAAINNLLAA